MWAFIFQTSKPLYKNPRSTAGIFGGDFVVFQWTLKEQHLCWLCRHQALGKECHAFSKRDAWAVAAGCDGFEDTLLASSTRKVATSLAKVEAWSCRLAEAAEAS